VLIFSESANGVVDIALLDAAATTPNNGPCGDPAAS
jgi:hypothetical protein